MSVTFLSNCNANVFHKDEPCLCAQMADGFCPMVDGEDSPEIRASLKAEARPDCPRCDGTGVETVKESDAPSINLANENAKILLRILGLQFDPEDLCGDMPIADARRALMRARSRSDLSAYVRPEEVRTGEPREEDGVVILHPVRAYIQGRSKSDLQTYIERFSAFVNDSAERGATSVQWY